MKLAMFGREKGFRITSKDQSKEKRREEKRSRTKEQTNTTHPNDRVKLGHGDLFGTLDSSSHLLVMLFKLINKKKKAIS